MSSRTRPVLAGLSILAAASLTLTACGSSGGGTASSAPAGGSSSSSSSSSVPSGAKALVPSKIASKGTLTFAMDATYPPSESLAKDGKTIVGLDADLAKAIAGQLGLKASLTNATFDTIIPGLQSGKFDVGMSSFTDTKEREKTVDFVNYFKAGEGFYVKAGSKTKFNGLASLCNHSVSVESGTTEQTDAKSQSKKCKVTVLTFNDQNAANLAVSSGRADVGFADSQVADYIVKQSNGQFESTGTAFAVAPYGIALPKGNGMAKAVQAAVQQLITDGTYAKVLATWGVSSGAVTAPTINGATS